LFVGGQVGRFVCEELFILGRLSLERVWEGVFGVFEEGFAGGLGGGPGWVCGGRWGCVGGSGEGRKAVWCWHI
jgi:hypothetical protein